MRIKSLLPRSWQHFLKEEFSKDYFANLSLFLADEFKSEIILPPTQQIFSAFDYCTPKNVKVIIMGQDPYHGIGQANGLCFSVSEEVKIPPSLRNIYKELHNDLGLSIPSHGNLESWATQGVLLLNAVLTVKESEAASHQRKGWENFTDAVISHLSQQKKGLIFILWGKEAQKKIKLIDLENHFILTADHPSPLSAYRGFFGCKHFSETNRLLLSEGKKPIDWQIR